MSGAGRRVAMVGAAVLVTGGGTAVGWAAGHQEHAPQAPLTAAAGTPGPTTPSAVAPPAPATALPAGLVTPALPPSPPVLLTIPAIGVHAAVVPVGLDPDGSLAVLRPGPHYDDAAWYEGSPTPGQAGPSIIEGHVDSAADGPSVFFRLGALRVGDQVTTARADGRSVTFTVTSVARYPKSAFPTDAVYADTPGPELRLITCGGPFDRRSGHYTDNTVVFATLAPGQ